MYFYQTVGYDPITPPEVAMSWAVEPMSLDELWPQCDYLTVHTPLMPSTTGNNETLKCCLEHLCYLLYEIKPICWQDC